METTCGILLQDLHTTARVLQVLLQTNVDVEERGMELDMVREEVAPTHAVCPKEVHLPTGYNKEEREKEALPEERKVVASKS